MNEQDITLEQARAILKVSEQYLMKILDDGELPYHTVGSDRVIVLSDLMYYKRKRDSARRKALEELIRISEENGLYEINDFPPERTEQ